MNIKAASPLTTDCRQALSDWISRLDELGRQQVAPDTPTAICTAALESARMVLGDISFPVLVMSVPVGSPEEQVVFEKIVAIRREFDQRYDEMIEDITKRAESSAAVTTTRTEEPEGPEEEPQGPDRVEADRNMKVLIDIKDMVNMILDLARHVQPYLTLRMEQGKVEDLAVKTCQLEDTIRGSLYPSHREILPAYTPFLYIYTLPYITLTRQPGDLPIVAIFKNPVFPAKFRIF